MRKLAKILGLVRQKPPITCCEDCQKAARNQGATEARIVLFPQPRPEPRGPRSSA